MTFWASLGVAAESFAGQGAVALGLLSPKDVASSDELTVPELAQRFVQEACVLKDSGKGSSSFLACGAPKVVNGQLVRAAGPGALEIDDLLRCWLSRLTKDSDKAAVALDALLQSLALNIVLQVLADSNDGRMAIRDSADSVGKSGAMPPLRAVLTHASAVPEGLMGQLIRLLADVVDAVATNAARSTNEADPSERALHWVLTLFSAALYDAGELSLCRSGKPVEIVQRAHQEMSTLSQPQNPSIPVEEAWDSWLDGAGKLGITFNELRGICEDLKSPQQPRVRWSDAPARALTASAGSLSSLREVNELAADVRNSVRARALFAEVGASSQEVEKLLVKRSQKLTYLASGLAELPGKKTAVAAACLECEKIRRRQFEDLLADFERSLWGPDTAHLAHDPARMGILKDQLKRAGGHVDQAWREMVAVAAEALDDNNAIGASSEEMSGAAKRYKEMRKELAGHTGRHNKLEANPGPKPTGKPLPRAIAVAQGAQAASASGAAGAQAGKGAGKGTPLSPGAQAARPAQAAPANSGAPPPGQPVRQQGQAAAGGTGIAAAGPRALNPEVRSPGQDPRMANARQDAGAGAPGITSPVARPNVDAGPQGERQAAAGVQAVPVARPAPTPAAAPTSPTNSPERAVQASSPQRAVPAAAAPTSPNNSPQRAMAAPGGSVSLTAKVKLEEAAAKKEAEEKMLSERAVDRTMADLAAADKANEKVDPVAAAMTSSPGGPSKKDANSQMSSKMAERRAMFEPAVAAKVLVQDEPTSARSAGGGYQLRPSVGTWVSPVPYKARGKGAAAPAGYVSGAVAGLSAEPQHALRSCLAATDGKFDSA